ncbi:hypothetical protein ACMZ75_01630 [Gardnerella piotii]|uniref:hypothetical protein n=1 Tax=Gardnerella piotii TaxID=2792977 RepID=UPI000E2A093C|nr:hypothetical protein CG395_03090 [Bifidobacteriaceae bacterium GH022]RIY22230.1 hypothetical protein CJI53_03715 [Bifidobacteriaceae bacterium VN002]
MKNSMISNDVKERAKSSVFYADVSSHIKQTASSENLEENDELFSTDCAAKLMHSYKQSASGLARPYKDVFAELEKGL